jgi:2-polyprenyl-3-methyl-5-hydroxy-6-metoxy-1,4-benzoquinol methylase
MHCNVCASEVAGEVERGQVRSNVRRFAQEKFDLWRCPDCKSIHASDEVDLDHYYAAYPFHNGGSSWLESAVYRSLHKRLKRAGLQKQHTILDYGCGNGMLVRFLRSLGLDAHGYDQHAAEFNHPELLERRWDCIVTQDVIEHVAEPWELLRSFDRMVNPGGLIAVGTPNAEALDLQDPEWCIHALHQPYHRHILSSRALRQMGPKLGWQLARWFPTEYVNTLVPFVNVRFVVHLMSCFDNTLDSAFEVETADRKRLLNAGTFWYGLFGYFYGSDTGVMAVFQKPIQ